jgi:hypothetical protein
VLKDDEVSEARRTHVSDEKSNRFELEVRREEITWETEKVTRWKDNIKANVKGTEVERQKLVT